MAIDLLKAQSAADRDEATANVPTANHSQLAVVAYWTSVGSTIGLLAYFGWLA
jgi:hypothetical protein